MGGFRRPPRQQFTLYPFGLAEQDGQRFKRCWDPFFFSLCGLAGILKQAQGDSS